VSWNRTGTNFSAYCRQKHQNRDAGRGILSSK
jgi:hypothetical protein